jgi:SAM-dependent methyltransferase
MKELEEVTDRFHACFLAERHEVSRELGPGFLVPELIDSAIRTTETENMDRGNKTGSEKLQFVRALHRMNSMMQIYPRHIEILDPLIRETAGKGRNPARILEIACGSGGLAFSLAEHARKNRIDLAVTASDIVPEFISEGNRLAGERKLSVKFIPLNAFEMHGFGKNDFDITVMSQSLHHFSPGQLATIIAQAKKHTATAFVGIDGHRSILLLAGVPLIAGFQGMVPFAQDGLTSARKFYSDLELEIIAGIATNDTNHHVGCSWPLTVLLARFDGRKAGAEGEAQGRNW